MKNLIVFIIIFLNLFQTKASNNKKEALFNKVSFFVQKNDSLHANKYSEINILFKEENYVQALEKALKLYDLCIESKNNFWCYKTAFLIAKIHDRTNKHKSSLELYKKSLQFYTKYLKSIEPSTIEIKDNKFTDSFYASNLLRIGNAFHKLSVSTEENNKLFYLDSAKFYYKKFEKLPGLDPKNEKLKATAFSNLSGIFEQNSIFDQAEFYARKAIEIHEKHSNTLGVAKAKNNLGNVFLSQKKFKKSKKIYLEALNLIRNNNNIGAIRAKASLNYNIAWTLRNLEDFTAYDYQDAYEELKDTLKEIEIRLAVEKMTHEYDFNRKKDFLDQKQEVEILQEKDKTRTIVVVGIFLFILLISIIGYYRFRQNNLELKITQSELLQNQNLEKIKSESQARVLDATLNGRETERKEIAETLHDSVSAMLSSANLHLQATRKQFDKDVPIEIDKTQKIINEASKKIRDLSHTLVSSVLLKFGLNFATNDIAEKYSNSELTINTEIEGLRRYHQKFEMKVHNIIQELTNNILKHSKASLAIIKIKEEDGQILIQIIDDGVGFDKTKITSKDGLGINQIEARILMMKGHFHIDSQKEEGTQIKIEIPIQEKETVSLF